jgi:transcriptional repressor NrdR
MQCPYCKEPESRVADSRLAAAGAAVWRRRECDACHRRFTTYERVEYTLPTVVKRSGRREAFDRSKLLRGLHIACNKRPISADVLEQTVIATEQELAERGEREVPSRVLGEKLLARLKKLDEVAYVRFASVYRSFDGIDQFMAELGDLRKASGIPEP